MGFGSGAYLALYFGGMIVASLYDLIKRRNDPYYVSIGASGAVSAVLFTSIFLDPWGRSCFSPYCLSPESIRLAISGLLPVYGETNRR